MAPAARAPLPLAVLVALALPAACGSQSHPPLLADTPDTFDAGDAAPHFGHVGGGGAPTSDSGLLSIAPDGGLTASDCTPEATNYVYLLDAANGFYRFDPAALTVTLVGALHCSTVSTPFSMAVRRDGTAFSVFLDGSLHSFDVRTLACQNLGFAAGQSGFTTFGMSFSTDGTSTTETLYVSKDVTPSTSPGLGKIDLTTLVLTPIGTYDDGITSWSELTGTGDGRLFGAFEGSPYVVAQIDESTAHILSQSPQTAISYPSGTTSLAFAFWGGVFYLFVGSASTTDVFRFDPTAQQTASVASIAAEIVGAGVSTCAPVGPIQ